MALLSSLSLQAIGSTKWRRHFLLVGRGQIAIAYPFNGSGHANDVACRQSAPGFAIYIGRIFKAIRALCGVHSKTSASNQFRMLFKHNRPIQLTLYSCFFFKKENCLQRAVNRWDEVSHDNSTNQQHQDDSVVTGLQHQQITDSQ